MNLSRRLRSALVPLTLLVFCLVPIHLAAQTQTGQLTGTVTQDGAALPGVRVTISSSSLQGTRSTDTDVNGNYNFAAVPPGEYTIECALEGMQTATRRALVTLSGVSRADAVMKLSALTEAITVTATTPSVVETPTMESNIPASTVESLPVPRTLLSTVTLSPNTNTNGPGGATTISGAASFDSTFYINGTPVNEVLRGQPLDLFIEDALQETTVLTGAISAEYGRFTGGVVNAISKSGGNQFTGSLRDSLSNPSWASTTPLNEPLLDKMSQTYEGTLGGKIVTDRLWFFAAGRYQDRSQQNFFVQSTQPYNTQSKQERIEAKVTAQITPKNSLVGSILKLNATLNDRCLAVACWDAASLSQQEKQPQDLYSASYNGILTNSFLIEGFWSKSDLKFDDSGAVAGDILSATPNYDANTGNVSGSSLFCATCGEEIRKSTTFGVKPHYFLSTPRLGTHNIVAGYEHYADSIFANNHQSGSDYEVYNLGATPVVRDASGNPLDTISPGAALVLWWPILENARPNDLATQGLFLNDKWDVTSRLNLNLGVRYDRNNGSDSTGKTVADDSKTSPRLGLTYDVVGDGRLRVNASYSEYVSKIQAGNIGDASSPAGSPSLLYWLYEGPQINGLPHDQFIQQVFNWFNSTGGINNRNFLGNGGFLLGGGTRGVSTQILGSLKSPGVNEVALGASTQLGRSGFFRVDFQDRKWNDFYTSVLNLGTGTVFDPLIGSDVDRGFITNSNQLTRKYRAVVLQGGYKVGPRLDFAINYTWSKLTGNTTEETQNAGPVPDNGTQFYPEITNYANHNPIGFLDQDQRHKLRAWGTYELPTSIGRFGLSVLERFDSGTPYSAIGTVDPVGSGVVDPGYLDAAAVSAGGFNYYFSPRGAFRWDNITATDVALNYNMPVGRIGFFAEAHVINAFNEHAQIAGNTTVLTAFTSGSLQTFNPFTETPVAGVNYKLGSNFGKATDPTDFQTPRTYLVSVGFKF